MGDRWLNGSRRGGWLVPGVCLGVLLMATSSGFGHGSAVFPESRAYKIFLSDPDDPDFALAEEAVARVLRAA